MITKVGIDPGPTYTGVSVVVDEKIVLSTTLKRPSDDVPTVWWAHDVASQILEILKDLKDPIIGVEGAVTPQSHFQGKKNFVNPKYLIGVGIMVGSISGVLASHGYSPVIVRPGKNGSGSNYPPELAGRRPSDLPGKAVGTRDHERSAYDVANQAPLLKNENYDLDYQKPLI